MQIDPGFYENGMLFTGVLVFVFLTLMAKRIPKALDLAIVSVLSGISAILWPAALALIFINTTMKVMDASRRRV